MRLLNAYPENFQIQGCAHVCREIPDMLTDNGKIVEVRPCMQGDTV